MNLRFGLVWVLAGGLGASTAVNIQLAFRLREFQNQARANATEIQHTEQTASQRLVNAAKLIEIDALGLSADQRERIRECAMTCFTMRSCAGREAERLAEDLECALSSDPPDEARALELAERIGKLRTQQFKRQTRSIMIVRKILTAEQLGLLATGSRR